MGRSALAGQGDWYTRAMLSMERPSTSHGQPSRSATGPFGGDYEEQRPHTAQGNARDSLSTEMADGSFRGGDQTAYEASEYRRRLDEFRQMSAPDLAGSAFGENLGPSGRLSQTDFLRFSRPSKLTGIRDKLKLETMSRAYGVSYSQPRRRQLSPVKKRAANGSALAFFPRPCRYHPPSPLALVVTHPLHLRGGSPDARLCVPAQLHLVSRLSRTRSRSRIATR